MKIRAKEGIIKKEEIRELIIENAIVDTGATMLSLPIDIIEKLGLEEVGITEVRTANGTVNRRIFRGAWIEINNREWEFRVVELSVGMVPLSGQIVLEQLDLYPAHQNQRLTGRPDAPDHMVIECY